MTAETYALLWSKRPNCFHIEPLADTEKKGRTFFRTNSTNDYLVIYVGTHAGCRDKADELRHVLDEREEVRRLYDSEDC